MQNTTQTPPISLNGIEPRSTNQLNQSTDNTNDHQVSELCPSAPTTFDGGRKRVWRSQPVFGEPGKSRSVNPVMSDGIGIEGFSKALETRYGQEYPLHLARLRFRDASAAEAYQQLERTHNAVAEESEQRNARHEVRRTPLLAEIAALGKEETIIRAVIEENRASVARLGGRLGFHVGTRSGSDIVDRLADARRVRTNIARGEPSRAPGFGRAAEQMGNLFLAALFALPLGIAIGLNLHFFDVRILEDPADAPSALALCYATAFAAESALGGLAERLGMARRGDDTAPTLTRCFATAEFYAGLAAFAFMEGLALEKISRFNASTGEPQLPLVAFVLIGAAINLTYTGLRIKKGADKRTAADIENALLGGSDFAGSSMDAKALAESINQITTGERRLQEISARIKILSDEHERMLGESMTKQSWDVLRQYGVEARVERARAEKEIERITNALEKLPGSLFGGYRDARRYSRDRAVQHGDEQQTH